MSSPPSPRPTAKRLVRERLDKIEQRLREVERDLARLNQEEKGLIEEKGSLLQILGAESELTSTETFSTLLASGRKTAVKRSGLGNNQAFTLYAMLQVVGPITLGSVVWFLGNLEKLPFTVGDRGRKDFHLDEAQAFSALSDLIDRKYVAAFPAIKTLRSTPQSTIYWVLDPGLNEIQGLMSKEPVGN